MKIDTSLSRKNFWAIAINSTTAFVLTYFFVFYTSLLTKIILTGIFDYSITFTYDTIFYHIKGHEWSHDSVRLIYSSGPILVFIFGAISLMIFSGFAEETSRVKVIFVWFSLHAFNFVFSGLSIGNIFGYGVGHVFTWMYLHDTAKMVIALIGFFGLLATAIIIVKPLVNSASSFFNYLDERNIPFFIMAQIIVPYIIGSALGIIFFLPSIPVQEEYSWVVMGVLLLIVSVSINQIEPIQFDNDKRDIGISWRLVAFTVVLLLAIRFGLSEGLTINW